MSSILAAAALARMASVAAGWPKAPFLGDAIVWWPTLGWAAASATLLAMRRRA